MFSLLGINAVLDKHYRGLVELLRCEFERFQSMLALAFDLNVNTSFAVSVELVRHAGCSDRQVLKSRDEIDKYFQVYENRGVGGVEELQRLSCVD